MFSQNDKEQINKQGISLSKIEDQLAGFRQGFPFINLKKPAVINDGILKLSGTDEQKYIQLYDEYSKKHKVLKFVPASGAATRMFKDLYAFLESDDDTNNSPPVKEVIQGIGKFAFFDELNSVLKKNGYEVSTAEPKRLIEFILTFNGLNYGALPKALLTFHKYTAKNRTSLEEHFVEGALYAVSVNGKAKLHFTVSPEHKSGFEAIVSKYIRQYEDYYHVKFEISYSTQLPSTDTIAVDLNNEPFRDKNGKLVFRPGGHGALINNLNTMNSDLIFIKNIDNVVPDRLKSETVKYKKVIAGLLVYLQSEIYRYQQLWDEGKIDEIEKAALKQFFKTYFHKEINKSENENIGKLLFRPIRVCGMVKNEGEPGGGPYWVSDIDFGESLQIIESSQIDMDDENQKIIFKQATHFNPVDLVCSVKNYKGKKYDLLNFVDEKTCFISHKSKDGKPLKALELPGLWNGAMANWNTIFVEVPIITFNPVKIINDLLRPQHS